MSEMIDRVARAIAEEINGGKFDDASWYNDDQREVHRRRARAAIEAIRKPTREQLQAAWDNSPVAADSDDFVSVWYAMIDAALNEKKPDAG